MNWIRKSNGKLLWFWYLKNVYLYFLVRLFILVGMFIYTCWYVYLYLLVRLFILVGMFIYTCRYVYLYLSVCLFILVGMFIYTFWYVYLYLSVGLFILVGMFIYTCWYVYLYLYLLVCLFIIVGTFIYTCWYVYLYLLVCLLQDKFKYRATHDIIWYSIFTQFSLVGQTFWDFKKTSMVLFYLWVRLWTSYWNTIQDVLSGVLWYVEICNHGFDCFTESSGYWTTIFCFLTFNLFAFLGNLVSEWIKWVSCVVQLSQLNF